MEAGPWYNQNWLIASVTLLGATATLIGSLLLWRQLIELNRKNRFDILQFAATKMQYRFGTLASSVAVKEERFAAASRDQNGRLRQALAFLYRRKLQDITDYRLAQIDRRPMSNYERFYALKDRFRAAVGALPESVRVCQSPSDYLACLCTRIQVVSCLSEPERRDDFELVRIFVNNVNDVAEMIEEGLIDRRSFFGRYHLALIREIYIAEPYIYYLNLHGRSGRWGMRVLRMGEMARAFNDINPIHRSPVYFVDDAQFGCIYRAPCGRVLILKKIMWRVRHVLGLYPSITTKSKAAQNRLVRKVSAELAHGART
jgi:hypothetical protein